MMTYWYQAVTEVIEDIRKAWPRAKIISGGNYVTLCTNHAENLGADFLVQGTNLQPLWDNTSELANVRFSMQGAAVMASADEVFKTPASAFLIGLWLGQQGMGVRDAE